jgi:hypothetical protein
MTINSHLQFRRRGLAPVFVIIAVAIVLIAGYLWWARSNRSALQDQNIITSTSTSQVQNASSTDTSGWKTYRNETNGFEVKYPPAFQVTEEASGPTEIHGADGGFNVQHRTFYDSGLGRNMTVQEVANSGVRGNKVEKDQIVLDGIPATKVAYCDGLFPIIEIAAKKSADLKIYSINMEPTAATDLSCQNGSDSIFSGLEKSVLSQILSTFKFIPSTGSGNNPPVACTEEAKQCPDGSYVGRTGPNCAFAACPAVSGNGILSGKVTVGPICPVERIGFPCLVPPTAYTSREVIVYAANGTTVIARKNFNSDGTYSFSLPAGSYVVNTPNSGIGGARNLPETVIIKSGETTTLDLSIDTGIR